MARCDTAERNFSPTVLYNEGWMLRLVLDWLSSRPGIAYTLSFSHKDRWYSEALLPSAFLARYRGDKLAESWTHADGIIGDGFEIGRNQTSDLTLIPNARRFIVLEAKMYSGLSPGVTHARYFNQAARNVACIAETVRRSGIFPSNFEKIGFYLIAPKSQIDKGVFARHMNPANIRNIIERRITAYHEKEKETWFERWFLPTMENIQISELPWEELITLIQKTDSQNGNAIAQFYEKCLQFNQPKANKKG